MMRRVLSLRLLWTCAKAWDINAAFADLHGRCGWSQVRESCWPDIAPVCAATALFLEDDSPSFDAFVFINWCYHFENNWNLDPQARTELEFSNGTRHIQPLLLNTDLLVYAREYMQNHPDKTLASHSSFVGADFLGLMCRQSAARTEENCKRLAHCKWWPEFDGPGSMGECFMDPKNVLSTEAMLQTELYDHYQLHCNDQLTKTECLAQTDFLLTPFDKKTQIDFLFLFSSSILLLFTLGLLFCPLPFAPNLQMFYKVKSRS